MKNLFVVLLILLVSGASAQNDVWFAQEDFGGDTRFLGTSFSIGTKIYAGTGLSNTTFVPLDDFWEFDVSSNDWTQKGSFDGGARYGTVSFSINGKGYVALGVDFVTSAHGDVWEYTPGTDTWLKKADFPGAARAGAFVFVVNNKAYVGAGQDATGDALADLWEYDPSTDAWVQKSALPSTPRLYAAAFAIDTKGYVGTGLDQEDGGLADFWEYDTTNDQWTRMADVPQPNAGAIGFATSTRGYMGLGSGVNLYSYYPNENVWVQEATYPVGFNYVNASCAMIGGKAYVGLGGASPSPKYYRYTPGTDQSITFNALASKTFGDAPFALTATSSSGLNVTYTSSDLSVATIVGSTLTIVGAGTTTIKASQAGNVVYDAALPVERVLIVEKSNQAITFNTLPGKNMGDGPFGLSATASSSLAVSYVSSNTSVATISGSTVTIVGAGTTTITASQPGNTNYNSATSVDRDLVVSKLNQAITFGALAPKTIGSVPFNLAATASSGLAVSYASSNTSVATISGSTVTVIGNGTTTITASQAGNDTYNAATSVDRDLVVAKGMQTWIGSLPTTGQYGTNITPALQLSSGLVYTLTSSNQNIATVALHGLSWVITPTGIGTTTLTASHAGTPGLEAAPTITADLVISKATQIITFTDFNATGGYSVTTATSSSGLAVTFDDPGDNSAVITGNIATVFGSFNGTLTARQAGNDFYLAVAADWTLVIGKREAPMTMEPIPEMAPGDPRFTPSVSTPSSLVTYTLSSTDPGVATIVGGQINLIGNGTAIIHAVNPGNDYYKPSSVSRELVVKDPHTLTFGELPVKTLGDAPFTVQATSSAGVPVTFSSSNPGIATVEGNTVTIRSAGSAWIIASAGDVTHARRNVSQVLTVKNGAQAPAQQGQFWGVSFQGGPQRAGVIYKTNSDGSGLTIVKELQGGANQGTHPGSSAVVASNGKIYGFTGDGAKNNEGALFEYDPATAAITKKYEFGWADYPGRDFVAAPNGKLYGSKTASVDNVYGSIVFEFDANTGMFTREKSVAGVLSWVGDVFRASNGKIYVSGPAGSQLERRAFAEWDPVANTLTMKADVPWSTPSAVPTGPVEYNGKFYGTTQTGGVSNEGFIYEFDPIAGTATQKLDFMKANFNRTTPQGLMRASNGKLYGCASWGGLNQVGYIYEYDPGANTMTTLADFPSFTGVPTGRMVEAPNGKLYGTDNSGNMGGSIFQFDPASNTLLPQIILNDNTGKAVYGSLGLLGDKFYGFASRGGINNAGTVFEFDYTSRVVTTKYHFLSATDGFSPMVGLTPTANGKLYGINKYGGFNDEGTIFEYDLDTDLYKSVFDFKGTTTGNNPHTPLLAGLNGKLYGGTQSGAFGPAGTIFEFDPNTGAYQTLIRLSSESGLGLNHQLVQSKTGKLFGLMAYGGANSHGTLFEVDPVMKRFRKLVDFADGNGSSPNTAPMIASNGKIYGTTPLGGANNVGVLFEYDLATSTYAVKHNFETATGAKPYTILTEVDGKLWGTTTLGGTGTANKGVIFQYDPSTGVYTKKYDFDTNGRNPGGNLLHASNGKLYIQTTGGGSTQSGETGLICEYDIATNTLVKKSELPPGTTQFDYVVNSLVQTTKSFRDDQVVTMEPIGTKVLGQAPFTAAAVATSGLPVVLSAGNAKLTVAADGKVTLAEAGKGIVKATQAGNATYNPAEAEAEFCINPAKPTVSSSVNSATAITLSSSNATGNQWYKDGVEITGAVNIALEITTVGVYTVKTVVEECASELSTPYPIVVTGDLETTLSAFSLYPNPAEDRLFIMLPGGNRKKVTLLQADGRVAEQHETSASVLELDVRGYAAGLYLVRIGNEEGAHRTIKFIKK